MQIEEYIELYRNVGITDAGLSSVGPWKWEKPSKRLSGAKLWRNPD